ncbi:hypothetical protein AAFF_G00092470 [Aldrovandia affinis]|uniref:Uncharacterized protein n=1 Tax=Aldrovandia affinis TaxID=143900 RepID=A0AAD7T2P7_9TELE|nr:hypothetical protein AAFF_G00092470 [Aldrovandia affinis]
MSLAPINSNEKGSERPGLSSSSRGAGYHGDHTCPQLPIATARPLRPHRRRAAQEQRERCSPCSEQPPPGLASQGHTKQQQLPSNGC